jgi:hypothetical protein
MADGFMTNPLSIIKVLTNEEEQKKAVEDARKTNALVTNTIIGASEIAGDGVALIGGAYYILAKPGAEGFYIQQRINSLQRAIMQELQQDLDQDIVLDLDNLYAFLKRFNLQNLITQEGWDAIFGGVKLKIPFSDLFERDVNGEMQLKAPFGTGLKQGIEQRGEAAFQEWFGSVWSSTTGPNGKDKLGIPDPDKPEQRVMMSIYTAIYEAMSHRFHEGAKINQSARAYGREIQPVGRSRKVEQEFRDTDPDARELEFSIGSKPIVINLTDTLINRLDATGNPIPLPTITSLQASHMHSRDAFDEWYHAIMINELGTIPNPGDEGYRDYITAYELMYERYMRLIDPLQAIAQSEGPIPFHHSYAYNLRHGFRSVHGREPTVVERRLLQPLQLIIGDLSHVTTDADGFLYIEALRTLEDLYMSKLIKGLPVSLPEELAKLDMTTRRYIRDAVYYFRENYLAITDPASPTYNPTHPFNTNPELSGPIAVMMDSDPATLYEGIPELIEGVEGLLPPAERIPPYNRDDVARYAVGTDPLRMARGEQILDLDNVKRAFREAEITNDRRSIAGQVKVMKDKFNLNKADELHPSSAEGKATVVIHLHHGPDVEINFGDYFEIKNGKHELKETAKKLQESLGTVEGSSYKLKDLSHNVLLKEFLAIWRKAYRPDDAAPPTFYLHPDFPHPGAPNYEEFWEAFHWFKANIMEAIDTDGVIRAAEELSLNGKLFSEAKGKKPEILLITTIGLDKAVVERLEALAKVKDGNVRSLLLPAGTTKLVLQGKEAALYKSALPEMQAKHEAIGLEIIEAKARIAGNAVLATDAVALVEALKEVKKQGGAKAEAIKKLEDMEKTLNTGIKAIFIDGLASFFRGAKGPAVPKDVAKLGDDAGIFRELAATFPPVDFNDKNETKRRTAIKKVFIMLNKLEANDATKEAFIPILSAGDPDFEVQFRAAAEEYLNDLETKVVKVDTDIRAIPDVPTVIALQTNLASELARVPVIMAATPLNQADVIDVQTQIETLRTQIEPLLGGIDIDELRENGEQLVKEIKGLTDWGLTTSPSLDTALASLDTLVKSLDLKATDKKVKDAVDELKGGRKRETADKVTAWTTTIEAVVLDPADLAASLADLLAALPPVAELNGLPEPMRKQLGNLVKTRIKDFVDGMDLAAHSFGDVIALLGSLHHTQLNVLNITKQVDAMLVEKLEELVSFRLAEIFDPAIDIDSIPGLIATQIGLWQAGVSAGYFKADELQTWIARGARTRLLSEFKTVIAAAGSDLRAHRNISALRDTLTNNASAYLFNEVINGNALYMGIFEQIETGLLGRLAREAGGKINAIRVTPATLARARTELARLIRDYSMVATESAVENAIQNIQRQIDMLGGSSGPAPTSGGPTGSPSTPPVPPSTGGVVPAPTGGPTAPSPTTATTVTPDATIPTPPNVPPIPTVDTTFGSPDVPEPPIDAQYFEFPEDKVFTSYAEYQQARTSELINNPNMAGLDVDWLKQNIHNLGELKRGSEKWWILEEALYNYAHNRRLGRSYDLDDLSHREKIDLRDKFLESKPHELLFNKQIEPDGVANVAYIVYLDGVSDYSVFTSGTPMNSTHFVYTLEFDTARLAEVAAQQLSPIFSNADDLTFAKLTTDAKWSEQCQLFDSNLVELQSLFASSSDQAARKVIYDRSGEPAAKTIAFLAMLVLGLPRETLEQVQRAKKDMKKPLQKAYRRLARIVHPDLNPGSAEAAKAIKSVTEAYEILQEYYHVS